MENKEASGPAKRFTYSIGALSEETASVKYLTTDLFTHNSELGR